ncbi:hypothetical protein BY996DRAFT_6546520 [Phakopsora pachyrhizi]|nr:hypothetical protein BY996DRAFT_6546520 [Phakopsora pachyrhizi]
MRGRGLKLKSLLAHQPAPHQPPGQTRYYQRIKSGSTENDIDRHQQEQNEGEDQEQKESQLCDGDDLILSNPFDDSDFELDEMDDSVCGSKFDLEEDEKRKQASKMEIRRSNGEAWLRDQLQGVVSNSTCQSGLELPEPIRLIELDREIFDEPLMINKLVETLTSLIGNIIFISNSISHEDSNGLNLLMIEDSGEGIGSEMMIEGSILGMILICLESLSEEGDDRLIRGSEDLILLVIDLCQKILEETKGDRDEDLIFKLYLDSDIYHTYIQKKLTLAEVGSSSGRPRPACLPDPTKKRRISQTIYQELKLPKNESSSSGLDDQQTKNATEETTLIPQIKKGFQTLNIFSIIVFRKEREKDQRINEELEQRNQS